jgi:hypothetical protein
MSVSTSAYVKKMAFVEERLAREKRQADERALRVHLEDDARDLADAHRPALLDPDGPPRLDQLLPRARDDLALDVTGDSLRLLLVAVQEQPPWTLRHVAPDEQDRKAHERGEA